MTFKKGLFLTLAAIALAGCNNTFDRGSQNTVANKESVADLSSLMAAHPEFNKASLKEIKNAAEGSNNNEVAAAHDLKFATNPAKELPSNVETKPAQLDKGIANRAQTLIDKILDEFNFEAHVNSDIKIIGIVMNMQREFKNKMEQEDKNRAKNMPSKDLAGMVAPEPPMPHKEEYTYRDYPPCEDLVENPFGNMSKEQFTAIINKNQEQLKKTISGCANIQGEAFVTCMDNFNKMAGIVNEHAHCGMNNLEELTKIAEKQFKKKFREIQEDSRECMNSYFSKCGFKIDKAQ